MSNAAPDTDWLEPGDPPSIPSAADAAGHSRIYRVEAAGESVTPFATLTEAIAEPPIDPEGEIRGPGGCLAQAAPDDQPCAWVLTAIGKARIAREHEAAA